MQSNLSPLPKLTLRNRDGSQVVLFPAGLTQSDNAPHGEVAHPSDAELVSTSFVEFGAPQAGRITPRLRTFLSVTIRDDAE